MNSSLSSPRLTPTVFDSNLSVPIQLIDKIDSAIKTNSQLLVGCYKYLSKDREVIQSTYISHLRRQELQFNQDHTLELTKRKKEFELSKFVLRGEDPITYGYQLAKKIVETEQNLLDSELRSQFGKIYCGQIKLRNNQDEFTADRWLIVLFNQYFDDKGTISRETYLEQIMVPKGDSILFQSMKDQPNPVNIFAAKAIEHLKKEKEEIFSKYSLVHESGNLNSIEESLCKIPFNEREIVLVHACLDCYEHIKALRTGAIQKIFYAIKRIKFQGDLSSDEVDFQGAHKCLSEFSKISERALQQSLTHKEVYVPLPALSPNNMHSLKELCKSFFNEISLFSKKLNDFIFLLTFHGYGETGIQASCISPRKEGDEGLIKYKNIFDVSLKGFRNCCPQL